MNPHIKKARGSSKTSRKKKARNAVSITASLREAVDDGVTMMGWRNESALSDEAECSGVEIQEAIQAEQTLNQARQTVDVDCFCSSGPVANNADKADQADHDEIQPDGVQEQILKLQAQLAHVVLSQVHMQRQVDQCTGLVNDDMKRMDAATQKRLTDLEASFAQSRLSLTTMNPKVLEVLDRPAGKVGADWIFQGRLDAVDTKVYEHCAQLSALELAVGDLHTACKAVSPSQLGAPEDRLAIRSPMFASQTGKDIGSHAMTPKTENGTAMARQDSEEATITALTPGVQQVSANAEEAMFEQQLNNLFSRIDVVELTAPDNETRMMFGQKVTL